MMTSDPKASRTTELELCNCDGFWHVECPDGITRYISEKSFTEAIHQKAARLALEAIGEDCPDPDELESVKDWKYYEDYGNTATDFVRGYNKAKAEIRASLTKPKEEI